MTNIQVLFFILSILHLRSLSTSDLILSCSQTPYPQVCTSMLPPTITSSQLGQGEPRQSFSDLILRATLNRATRTHQTAMVMNVGTLRSLILRATLNRATRTHQTAMVMNVGTLNARAKAAWADCLELYQDTIQQLNRSMSTAAAHEDVQTWLSAAIANQETCRNGFDEFNLTFNFQSSPFSTNNVSESISNLLAVNKAMAPSSSPGLNRKLLSQGFPEWVSAADRRLLQTGVKANIVVAQDGSGNYKTISAAVAASSNLRKGSTSRFVIYVKAGVYKENVEVTKSMMNLMIVGDGIDKTVVTGSKNVLDGSTTFRSATFAVTGNGFIAQDITFENTAGPQKHQAVAFRSGSDLSVYYRCSFKGYQDTLYVYTQRQFYRNCDIYGTVDFIFGDAVAVFQNCNIYVRKPMTGQKNTITAQGRKDTNENTGIVIHNSVIAPASDLNPVQRSIKSYLGRPWKAYSRTVIIKTSISSLIDPAGWLEWSGNFALSTLYYGEYMNTGSGASTRGRVKWPGYHVISSATEAGKYAVGNFLMGSNWIPATGIPFTSGL